MASTYTLTASDTNARRHAALRDAIALVERQMNRRSVRARRVLAYLTAELADVPPCWENFHERTNAWFLPCELPQRAPDYRSASGSLYWNTGNGVIRVADHWGSCIASCDWYMAGANEVGFFGNGQVALVHGRLSTHHDLPVAGFASWDMFSRRQ